ncbi:RelA/SpoT family protein [Pantoea sp. Aalb]|uniref:RelA/SpoT family protein n=1 Tax=Pantoea sp. Aalb TaxID=2576762 RepID=UPI00132BC8FD|nr:RelA/SpoT family protein [Pantoea sp. Aalb]
MYLFESLNKITKIYLSDEQIYCLNQAYIVACNAHKGQKRSSGEPYITHPIAVACILAKMKLDYETLMGALLHDVIEDTSTTYQDIENLFGKNVAKLVEGVSKLDKIHFRDKQEEQVENFRKMIIAMVKDIRVIFIKLADRTHNMRTLSALRPDKKRRIALETLEIYSPLAQRLGIRHLKIELEELSFETLYPTRFRVIQEVVKTVRENRKEIIRKITTEIDNCLQETGITCRVSGRKKHLYSIYRKMHLKEQRLNSIRDIYSFYIIIIVQDLDTCYRVLGQMHGLYKPRPGRVKDYIAIPKTNGYQSLHTSMIGPYGIPVEIQIRTEDMDHMAEMGVAAHWSHKKDTSIQIRAQRWLQSLLELQQNADNSFEFIENVKSDLILDEIYVFTPKGHIIELPAGATPVDFAYAVHTDIGHTCIGVRVDCEYYPLSKPLITGQTIEIITSLDAYPNESWLNFVVSSKAKSKIRQLTKNFKYEKKSLNLRSRLLLKNQLNNSDKSNNKKINNTTDNKIKKELNWIKSNLYERFPFNNRFN